MCYWTVNNLLTFFTMNKFCTRNLQSISLREKCPNAEFFLVWIQENTYQKKTPYLDTFHSVFKTQQAIKQPVLQSGFHYLRIKTYDVMTVWNDRYSAVVRNHPRLAVSQTSLFSLLYKSKTTCHSLAQQKVLLHNLKTSQPTFTCSR